MEHTITDRMPHDTKSLCSDHEHSDFVKTTTKWRYPITTKSAAVPSLMQLPWSAAHIRSVLCSTEFTTAGLAHCESRNIYCFVVET
jgi:hypothetical protein